MFLQPGFCRDLPTRQTQGKSCHQRVQGLSWVPCWNLQIWFISPLPGQRRSPEHPAAAPGGQGSSPSSGAAGQGCNLLNKPCLGTFEMWLGDTEMLGGRFALYTFLSPLPFLHVTTLNPFGLEKITAGSSVTATCQESIRYLKGFLFCYKSPKIFKIRDSYLWKSTVKSWNTKYMQRESLAHKRTHLQLEKY